MGQPANFKRDLTFSQECSLLPFWEEIYRKAFPDFDGMRLIRENGPAQVNGIDRQIFLRGSDRIITVDEKARRVEYQDILIEYAHKFPNGCIKDGWVEKPLYCDYLAYAFVKSGRCYLLPFQQLRATWHKNRTLWMDKYADVSSQNDDYATICKALPINVLYKALGEALRIYFTPLNDDRLSLQAQTRKVIPIKADNDGPKYDGNQRRLF